MFPTRLQTLEIIQVSKHEESKLAIVEVEGYLDLDRDAF
jgi:hypothetical protein